MVSVKLRSRNIGVVREGKGGSIGRKTHKMGVRSRTEELQCDKLREKAGKKWNLR